MKGIIFNLLQDVVSQHHGEDVWDDLIDAAQVDGVYTSAGSYPDEDMTALVNAAGAKLGLSSAEVLRWFGKEAMPHLARLFPGFFGEHVSARTFVLGVNDIIHFEVRKIYVGAECPHFHIREGANGSLSLDYRSTRRLCALGQGFLEGAGAHYGEELDVQHPQCIDRGDARCIFHVHWPQFAA